MADPLSRRPDHDQDSNIASPDIKPAAFSVVNALECSLQLDSDLSTLISNAYKHDKNCQKIILKRLSRSQHDAFHDRYFWDSGKKLLFLLDGTLRRLYIPTGPVRLQLLAEHHDSPTGGHLGRDKTYNRLARNFYWPGMSKSVWRFVKSCDRCQRAKEGRSPHGLLQPLSVPQQPWSDISMDFVMGLPRSSDGFDAIFTFVDRLTKLVHLIPVCSNITAKEAAKVYVEKFLSCMV